MLEPLTYFGTAFIIIFVVVNIYKYFNKPRPWGENQ